MKRFDMTSYKAFEKMGISCGVRGIKEKKVRWPDFGAIEYSGGRYLARMMDKSDFERCAEFWRSSYPEVYGSTSEWFLFSEEYESRFVTASEYESGCVEKKHCMLIMEDMERKTVAGASILTKDDRNLSIEYSFGAMHPEYRKSDDSAMIIGAAADAIRILEEFSGAEYFSAFCETWHSITQYLCFKRWGWKIAGIFPAQYTRWCRDNLEYRGCTVHFYKLLNGAEKHSTPPSEWRLIPEVRKLWEALEEINMEACDEISRKGEL